VRAFRHAGIDLQQRVHDDIAARGSAYRVSKPDANIDHRRVRNLAAFFERHATSVPLGEGDWRPGDIVVWDLYGGASPNHIGIVSDRTNDDGDPFVIHHFPRAAGFTGFPSDDDCLRRWRILAHFRWREEP
jgi:uncharacterized protein YijF (DUF1287 family)